MPKYPKLFRLRDEYMPLEIQGEFKKWAAGASPELIKAGKKKWYANQLRGWGQLKTRKFNHKPTKRDMN